MIELREDKLLQGIKESIETEQAIWDWINDFEFNLEWCNKEELENYNMKKRRKL